MRRIVLSAWFGVVIVASLVVLFVAIEQSGSSVRSASIALGSWFPAVITLLGAVIAVRQPKNRVAWLLIGIGIAVLVEYFVQLSLVAVPASPSLGLVAIVLAHIALPTAFYLLFLIAFLFPTGRFATRRQAWAAWPGVVILATVALIVTFTAEVGPPYPSAELAWTVDNPVGFLPAMAVGGAILSGVVVLVVMAVGGVLSLIMRYRRSSAVTKAQIRWMLLSTMIVGGVLALVAVTNASEGAAGGLLLQVAFVSIPASITVAITRYRLFDIDRLINRTVVYGTVVAALAAFYAVAVSASAVLLPTADNDLAIVASVLIAAAAFNPLRRRVQAVVDRRFYRSHYNAQLIAKSFTEQVRDEVDPDAITDDWIDVVTQTMQPEAVGVWIKDDASLSR